MGRIVNTSSPGKVRGRHRRTIAELLKRLGTRQLVDEETQDMVAAIIFALRGIHHTVLQTVEAWEKRDYWTKADRFLRDWDWVMPSADSLEESLRRNEWASVATAVGALMPHFIDIDLKKMTRLRSTWQGAYARLLTESRSQSAHIE